MKAVKKQRYKMKKRLLIKWLILLILLSLTAVIKPCENLIIAGKNNNYNTYCFNARLRIICNKNFKSCSHVIYRTKTALKIQTSGTIRSYVLNSGRTAFESVQNSYLYPPPKRIAVLYIATGRYIVFWNQFYQSAEKFLLPKHKKTYFLFTDAQNLKLPENVVQVYQKQEPWPLITLKRYHFFLRLAEQLKTFDYIYFFNANIILKQEITEEIFPTDEQEIMVALHPGYYRVPVNHLPYDRNSKSRAFIPQNEGKYYVLGGFNGGTAAGFLKMAQKIKEETDAGLNSGIIPLWHDESMLNRYLLTQTKHGLSPLILLPEYAVPETGCSRVDEFRPYTKIIILDKNNYGGHAWLRGLE